MPALGSLVRKVRSKNAGPFWLTIDIFCGSEAAFDRVSQALTTERMAALFKAAPETLKRFDIRDVHVIKFSLPRPNVQGSRDDHDMHGAAWAALVSELEI